MSGGLLLGLDVGTSAIKAALIDESGAQVAAGRAATPWRPVATGAELDPDELLAATARAAAGALDAVPAGSVAAIGIASMAETGVLADARGRPVVPSIAWHDVRGGEEGRRLAVDLGAAAFAERTGLPPSALCTVAKYRWMRAHWPAAARGRHWLNVAEWIVRGLGGDPVAEASLASRTGFYDLHARRPWSDALAWADAPAGLVAAHAPAGTAMGRADGDLLPRVRGAVVTVGGHDHLAAAVGADAAGEGDVLDSCGTAEAWVRACAPLAPAEVGRAAAEGISVGWHAVEGRQALLGSIRSGAILTAVLDLLGIATDDRGPLETAALDADPGGLDVSGFAEETLSVHGLRRGASPAALYRAALEAIGRGGADVLAHMEAVAGPRGGSSSPAAGRPARPPARSRRATSAPSSTAPRSPPAPAAPRWRRAAPRAGGRSPRCRTLRRRCPTVPRSERQADGAPGGPRSAGPSGSSIAPRTPTDRAAIAHAAPAAATGSTPVRSAVTNAAANVSPAPVASTSATGATATATGARPAARPETSTPSRPRV